MGKQSRTRDRRPKARRIPGFIKLAAALAVVALLLYGVTEMSGVPYDEGDIGVVDFSSLTRSQKREALQAANRSRCTCGCGMNTAQCVATDSTCPVREDNIKKIRTMVRDAGAKS